MNVDNGSNRTMFPKIKLHMYFFRSCLKTLKEVLSSTSSLREYLRKLMSENILKSAICHSSGSPFVLITKDDTNKTQTVLESKRFVGPPGIFH